MEFQKTKILRYILALIVSIAIFVLISFIFVTALKSGHSGSVLFGFMLLFIGLCVWSSYKNLQTEIKSYKNKAIFMFKLILFKIINQPTNFNMFYNSPKHFLN